MKNERTKKLILCAMFAALISVGAFIKIPFPGVPFTLQYFFTMLAGMLLGSRMGAVSVLVYIFMGLAGIPVFSGGGGISYVMVPSFGYIIGFAAAAYVTGAIANSVPSPGYKRLLTAGFAGLAIVYLFGIIYFYLISTFYLDKPMGMMTLFLYSFLQTIPGDIVKCGLAALITKRLIHAVKGL